MNYEILKKESFCVCGLKIEISTSQNENAKIIANHWKNFNYTLKKEKVKLGSNWKKLGITMKVNDKYFYMAAIPVNSECEYFETETINQGNFIRFEHKGHMGLMKTTLNKIYRDIIPISGLQFDENRKIMHYEQYDFRFNWNNPDSVIDIYVPFNNNQNLSM